MAENPYVSNITDHIALPGGILCQLKLQNRFPATRYPCTTWFVHAGILPPRRTSARPCWHIASVCHINKIIRTCSAGCPALTLGKSERLVVWWSRRRDCGDCPIAESGRWARPGGLFVTMEKMSDNRNIFCQQAAKEVSDNRDFLFLISETCAPSHIAAKY